MPAPPAAVLVTRPEPGAAETAARVAAQGWTPVVAPALVLAPRRGRPAALPAAAAAAQALLLPSRAAARAVAGAVPPGLPVLAVGEGTAAEARAQGFRDVTAAAGLAVTLAALAGERLDPAAGPLLLAVGENYGMALAGLLRARGFRVLRRVVYTAVPADTLPPAARAALLAGRVVSAMFFSPRSAAATISLLQQAGPEIAATPARIEALAISPRVAEVLRRGAAPPLPAWRRIRVAARPDQDAMLALLGPCPAASADGQDGAAENAGVA